MEGQAANASSDSGRSASRVILPCQSELADSGRFRPPLGPGWDRLVFLADDESGQTLVVAALCMAILIGMLGLVVDAGVLSYEKAQLQNAADAAALAGALELSTCGSTANCAVLQTAAQDALVENGLSGSTLYTGCATTAGTGLKLMVNNPPCTVASDPNRGKTTVVETVVSKSFPTTFVGIFGLKTVPVSVRAEAALRTQAGQPCVYALDPSANGALQIANSSSVVASCGISVESSSSSALLCNSSSFNVSGISVVGNISQSGCTFNAQPKVNANLPHPADPLSSLPTPAIPTCGTSTSSPYHGASNTVDITGSATLYPDFAYCGGITISSTANITLMPGTYVLITSGNQQWGLHLCVQATMRGTGVTFYNKGVGQINLYNISTGTGGVALTAPTSGTYAGILFFQDSHNNAPSNIIGTPQWNTVLEGAYYFPSAAVTFDYNGVVKYNFLVAKDIQFANLNSTSSGQSTFTSDYSTLPNGSPLGGGNAAIVQ